MKKKIRKRILCLTAFAMIMVCLTACDLGTLWSVEESGSSIASGNSSEKTLENEKYIVTYVTKGGSVVENQIVEEGNTPIKPTDPSKEGYVFEGWYTDEACTQAYFFEQPLMTNITLYAKFTEKPYVVKFVADNGENIVDQVVEKGKSPVKPGEPSKEGSIFEGWYLESTFETEYTFDAPLNTDTTLYAKFEVITYTVRFMTNGGTEVTNATCEWGCVPVRPADPTNGNLHFIGWYLDETLTEKYDFALPLNTDTTLYAYFTDAVPVYTAEELIAIGEAPSAKYILMNDINLKTAAWSPITSFSGELDGNGYKIYNFVINTTGKTTGFVAVNDGLIKRIKFDDFMINLTGNELNADYHLGVIAGDNSGEIEDCEVTNAVLTFSGQTTDSISHTWMHLGVLVGENKASGTVKGCCVESVSISGKLIPTATYYNGSWHMNYYRGVIGGAVGLNRGKIENTLSDTSISVVLEGKNAHYAANAYAITYTGGFVGENYGDIENCGTNVLISVTATPGDGQEEAYLGGFVAIGYETGRITGCYAKGSVGDGDGGFAILRIGGFIDENSQNITDSYTEVDIKTVSACAYEIGGFAALNKKVLTHCYASGDIVTASTGNIGGFVGYNDGTGSVSACFTLGNIEATHENANGFVGGSTTGHIIFKCYENAEAEILLNDGSQKTPLTSATVTGVTAKTKAEILGAEFLVETLGWDASVWKIDGTNEPVLVWE